MSEPFMTIHKELSSSSAHTWVDILSYGRDCAKNILVVEHTMFPLGFREMLVDSRDIVETNARDEGCGAVLVRVCMCT